MIFYLSGCVRSTAACVAPGRVCSTAACVASRRVCSTANCAALDCLFYRSMCCPGMSSLQQYVLPWTCLFYSCRCCPCMACLFYSCLCCPWACMFYCSLCCAWTCVFYSKLCCPGLSVLQQHVLPWTCLFYSCRCCRGCECFTAVCACFTSVCAVPEHVCSTAPSTVPVDYVLQQTVVHLYMSAYKSFCAAPGRVCLQETVLHLKGGWTEGFSVFSICLVGFETVLFVFGCFDTGPKHRNKLNQT
jgi:hypothetical protein